MAAAAASAALQLHRQHPIVVGPQFGDDNEEMVEQLVPACLRQSPPQCREIQISAKVPLEWALPLYGFLMPLVVAITVLTNSFIVVVLSHRSLRTPTNVVLGAMAISELLTGLVCLPWLLYYYTFKGFETDQQQGLPPFWCNVFPYLATILPSIFHTAAIWLTVYLAVQRFIYICLPKLVRSWCTVERSKQVIISICVLSIWIYAPELFASYNQSFRAFDLRTNRTRSVCLMSRTVLIQMIGNNLYHMMLYGLHTILVHTLPCILLVFFTWRLIAAIRRADKKYSCLVGRGGNQSSQYHQQHRQQHDLYRKCTSTGTSFDDNGTTIGIDPASGLLATATSNPRYSIETTTTAANAFPLAPHPAPLMMPHCVVSSSSLEQQQLQTTTNIQQGRSVCRSSISDSKRVQALKQNTRMLLAVILLFLMTEIPAALIFSMHVGTVALKFTFIQQHHYAVLNKLLIVRNVLIVISYPLRFAIYCGMSAQFREVVQQMLIKHRKFTLFCWHFPYVKLYTTKEEARKAAAAKAATGTAATSPGCANVQNANPQDGSGGKGAVKRTTSVVLQNNNCSAAAAVVRRTVDDSSNSQHRMMMANNNEHNNSQQHARRPTWTLTTELSSVSPVPTPSAVVQLPPQSSRNLTATSSRDDGSRDEKCPAAGKADPNGKINNNDSENDVMGIENENDDDDVDDELGECKL